MKIVLYQDRNLKDKRINEGINSLHNYFIKNNDKYNYEFIEYKNFKLVKADYAIMWNVYCKFKKDTIYRKYIKDFQKKNNDKLIIIELGFIDRDLYYSLSYDHIANFGSYPNFPNNNDRFNKLNIKIKNIEYKKDIKYPILLCSQVPWDVQVQDINYSDWILNTIILIKKYTKREIIFRKHPKHTKRNGFNYYDNDFFKKNNISIKISNNSLKDDLLNSYCTIAYNSTVLVDAILEGIPIIAFDKSSIIYELSENIENIENLKKLNMNNIYNCLNKISYKQWNIEELENGIFINYYI